MRRCLFIILLFVTGFVTACHEEDKNSNFEGILGKWKIDNVHGMVTESDSTNGFGTIYSTGTDNFRYQDGEEIVIDFFQNYKYTLTNLTNISDSVINGFFSINGDRIYIANQESELSQQDEYLKIVQMDDQSLLVNHYISIEWNGEISPFFLSQISLTRN